eukprot:CAMPEP_0180411568 /NCGR_PEP_ID=MMETSP0989-20121125/44053_1 /TAXON_ID=697907 /ORGANISM="non described non described, Strain CCMP2293" /LENGTH=32 /DNA_ID= /DNA_START= /DNA_END= /DNA_ORIENTATION=
MTGTLLGAIDSALASSSAAFASSNAYSWSMPA